MTCLASHLATNWLIAIVGSQTILPQSKNGSLNQKEKTEWP